MADYYYLVILKIYFVKSMGKLLSIFGLNQMEIWSHLWLVAWIRMMYIALGDVF